MIMGVPAIVVTKKDITISQLGYTIEWRDIEEMNLRVTQGKGRSYNLEIAVKEPWKYISQIRNPIMRYYRWYMLDYYNPFTVSLSLIEGNSCDAYSIIESYFHNYKNKEW